MDAKSTLKKLGEIIFGTYKSKPKDRKPITGIKPCPYCGRSDHLMTKDNGPEFPDYRIAIFCVKCGFYYAEVDQETCIEKWNDFPRDAKARELLHQMYK